MAKSEDVDCATGNSDLDLKVPVTVSPPEVLTNPTTLEVPVSAPEVKKPMSWASVAKPKEGEKFQEPTSGSPRNMKSTTAPLPFVITSEENQHQKDSRKFQNLGEMLLRKNLMNKELNHQTLYVPPRGMMNRGNACYANAILQTLVFCPPFFHLLESLDILPDSPTELPPITSCFVQLMKEFKPIPSHLTKRAQLRSEEPPLDPSFVYDAIQQHGTSSQQQMLIGGRQEDAQEFLNHILQLIHEEMVKGLVQVDGYSAANREDTDSDEWMHIKKNQKKSILRDCDFKESPVSHVFCGKLRSVRKLQGAKEFESVEPFFMLDLPIQVCRVFIVELNT